jgi:chromate transport protein ChrA
VSLAAASIPASVIIALLSATLARVDEYPMIRVVIAIALIVATLLVLATAWNLLRPYIKGTNAVRTAIIGVVVVALVLMRVTPVRILLVAAILGVVMASPAAPPVAEVDR